MENTTEQAAKKWNYKAVLISLLFAYVLQTMYLQCACRIGSLKMELAMGIDLLILLRLVIARSRKETGRGWLFYAALPYAMIPIIEIISRFYAPH